MMLRERAYWIFEEAAWQSAPSEKGDIYRFYRSRDLQGIGDYIAKHLPKGFRAVLRVADPKGEKVSLHLNSKEKGKVRIHVMAVEGMGGLSIQVLWGDTIKAQNFSRTLSDKEVSKWVNDQLVKE